MHMRPLQLNARGFTFVELLVTAAVTALVFGGLMASVQFAVKLISTAKAKTGAVSLANERLEYIRSLTYADVGTIAGIPSGPIPQHSAKVLNSITYHERVLIQYVDAPDDGLGASDDNGILADYKRAKIEYSWLGPSGTSSLFLQSDIAPPGIESTAGGGTLMVNVFDADVQPVSSAAVRVINNTTTSTIDITQYTNASGIAFFAGAPAAAQYQISVTKSGYSTDATHTATTSNPDPVTPPAAVLEGAVSTMNFQIDQLSELTVRTVEPATTGLAPDSFDDVSMLTNMTNVVQGGSDVVLAGSPGSYVSTGSLQAASTTPSSIDTWDVASWGATTNANTSVVVRVYAVSGTTYTLIADSDLPGNAAGFSTSPISLASIDPNTYPTLALGATLETTNVNETPTLHDWQLSYIIDEPPIDAVSFTLESTKIIGNTPVFKYQDTHVTDSSGEVTVTDLEWGAYKVFIQGGSYDIREACPALPFTLQPDTTDTLTLTLVPSAVRSIRVSVVDTGGVPVIGADVEISRSGFTDQEDTSSCGQSFFNSGLADADDYVVDVSASGFVSQSVTAIGIHGDESIIVTLVAS
jgi:hypothetical protein